jgi:hypothetical protein
VAEDLDVAHRNAIVHRDVKPEHTSSSRIARSSRILAWPS